ncbi:hypothetical protein Tco_0953408 [Tanacetum coccineum]|uniref:Cytochrome c biogenesis FC n=1 Tax=Tanacetum coccineum TaxID=301880 RepID=A0ABQ5E055_9ASTR
MMTLRQYTCGALGALQPLLLLLGGLPLPHRSPGVGMISRGRVRNFELSSVLLHFAVTGSLKLPEASLFLVSPFFMAVLFCFLLQLRINKHCEYVQTALKLIATLIISSFTLFIGGGWSSGSETIVHSMGMILLILSVSIHPITGNFIIPCVVDGTAFIFRNPGLSMIPLNRDVDLTTMKSIYADEAFEGESTQRFDFPVYFPSVPFPAEVTVLVEGHALFEIIKSTHVLQLLSTLLTITWLGLISFAKPVIQPCSLHLKLCIRYLPWNDRHIRLGPGAYFQTALK